MIKYSFSTKLGNTTLYSEDNKIIKINLDSDDFFDDIPNQAIIIAKKQILEYFDNKRTYFDFPYLLEGSDFSKFVLGAMKKIPYNETWSYSRLAKASGNEKAIRAVGTVCKNNSLPLLFPCHRVIKKNGDIGQFNGGVKMKEYLLNLERDNN
ncbi:MAG: methylated-DNA--[protein]-cysteine S-methyltransferase [Candidatus Izimaplasma sp.]|nr:methylated-DNA--[protein]-cysteine S-methyltransferase [Candidatus Izimaplasma bacterium]